DRARSTGSSCGLPPPLRVPGRARSRKDSPAIGRAGCGGLDVLGHPRIAWVLRGISWALSSVKPREDQLAFRSGGQTRRAVARKRRRDRLAKLCGVCPPYGSDVVGWANVLVCPP